MSDCTCGGFNECAACDRDNLIMKLNRLKAENERYEDALTDIAKLGNFFGGDKRVKFAEAVSIAKKALDAEVKG